jgi:glycosyltransferase involved in cell wall biosynthesis
MKILVSHPTANANTKEVVEGLLQTKQLQAFYTAIAVFPKRLLYQLGNIKPLKDLHRRAFPKYWEPFTKSNPWIEFGRLLASKVGWHKLKAHEKGLFCVDKMYGAHDNWVASNLVKEKENGLIGVYAYEDGALKSFTKAKELGIQCIYDLPIGYWKSARILLQEEFDANPAWAATLTGFKDSPEKLARKDQELALADVIFVASSFTKKTLETYPGKLPDIQVIPYGFPEVTKNRRYSPLTNRKLKVLFVGGLSQRKGISYLFDAVKGMESEIDLTIVGRKSVPDCSVLNKTLNKHTWIPSMPHNEVLTCMRNHDVLVFPSLFEGFGMVISEAMSQGTPVITTDRTAGPDLIENGIDGWLVETASSNAIKKVLENILMNPKIVSKMGAAAQQKAKDRPWSKYGYELAAALNK